MKKEHIERFWKEAEEGQLGDLLEFAKDEKVRDEARKQLKEDYNPDDVFEYLKNKR